MIPTTNWGAPGAPGSCVSSQGVATLSCIPIVAQNVINFLVLFAGVVCVFLIIMSGYKFVTSEGDPEKIASARKTLFYAIGGFLLVIASFVILNIIANYTGVSTIAPLPSTP